MEDKLIKNIAAFFLISLMGLSMYGKNYYVSNSGDDTNSGTSESAPWRTIEKVNSNMNLFIDGDVILFKSGDSFRGSIKVIDKNNLIFGRYGSGDFPKITAVVPINGWKPYSGNIYSIDTKSKVYQLFKNGVALMNGRLPAYSKYGNFKNYYSVTSGSGKRTFVSKDLIGMANLKGATVHMQDSDWTLRSRRIVDFNSGTGAVTLDSDVEYELGNDDIFFINNHQSLLKKEGDWYYDDFKLYLYSSGSPQNIAASIEDGDGIYLSGSDNIRFSELEIFGFRQFGIRSLNSNNLNVENCLFDYNYEGGIFNDKSTGVTYFKNKINNSVVNAIYNNSNSTTISENEITNVGLQSQISWLGMQNNFNQGTALLLYGSAVVRNNSFYSLGYLGISLYFGASDIEQNFIKDHCLTLHDGAAIYSWSKSFDDSAADHSVIKRNIIEGADFGGATWYAQGIYLDDRSTDITVEDNTVENTFFGVFLHNTKRHIVRRNNIYNTTNMGIFMREDKMSSEGQMVDNLITHNEIFVLNKEYYKYFPMALMSTWEHYDFGTYDYNKYYHPYYKVSIGLSTASINDGAYYEYKPYTLSEWTGLTKMDVNSKEDKLNWIAPAGDLKSQMVYNKKTTTQVIPLEGLWEDLDGKIYNGGISLESFSSKILIKSDQSTGGIDVNAGEDKTICQGDEVTLTASGGTTYTWSNGATGASIKVSPDTNTTYTVTASDGINTGSDSVEVIVNKVIANAGPDQNIVSGETITLSASGGDSYLWNNGLATASIEVNPAETTTYSVVVTSKGCSDSDEVVVFVENGNPVQAYAGEDKTICQGDEVTLTASGGTTYTWSNGATGASIKVSPDTNTTYTVTASDGINTGSDSVEVIVNKVIANAGPDQNIVSGETITLSASGGDSYLWNNGLATASIEVNPAETTTYSVVVTSKGCSDSDEVTVSVEPEIQNPAPDTIILQSDLVICAGESIKLNGTEADSFLWSTGETDQNIVVSPKRTTEYSLEVRIGSITYADTVIVVVDECTPDIAESTIKESKVDLYPNPSNGIMNLKIQDFSEGMSFMVSDLKGSTIYSGELEINQFGIGQLNMSDHHKGVYFVRIFNQSNSVIKKILLI